MEESLEIIKKYCGNVEERIRSCRSRAIAESLADRLCFEVNQNCKSDMVQNVLKSYVSRLVNDIFDQNGRNKYLEDRNAH